MTTWKRRAVFTAGRKMVELPRTLILHIIGTSIYLKIPYYDSNDEGLDFLCNDVSKMLEELKELEIFFREKQGKIPRKNLSRWQVVYFIFGTRSYGTTH